MSSELGGSVARIAVLKPGCAETRHGRDTRIARRVRLGGAAVGALSGLGSAALGTGRAGGCGGVKTQLGGATESCLGANGCHLRSGSHAMDVLPIDRDDLPRFARPPLQFGIKSPFRFNACSGQTKHPQRNTFQRILNVETDGSEAFLPCNTRANDHRVPTFVIADEGAAESVCEGARPTLHVRNVLDAESARIGLLFISDGIGPRNLMLNGSPRHKSSSDCREGADQCSEKAKPFGGCGNAGRFDYRPINARPNDQRDSHQDDRKGPKVVRPFSHAWTLPACPPVVERVVS